MAGITRGRAKGHPKTGGRRAGTRNKLTAPVMEVAGEYTVEAVGVLVTVMRNTEAP